MLTVVIETSTERGAIGLASCYGNSLSLLAEEQLPYGYQSSKYLLPFLQKLFLKCSKDPKELNFITLGVGPGSYTGMRVGASIGKTLAFALQIPIVGVNSLAGFIGHQEGPFASMIDAKIGGVYLLCGEKKGNLILYQGEPILVPLNDLTSKLKGITQWITPSSNELKSRFQCHLPHLKGEWSEKPPSIAHMANLGLQFYANGALFNAETIDLLYLRKTQAELEKGI